MVFLGDLIDRGADSRGVIEHLMTADWGAITPVFLMGNHEEAFLASYNGDLDMLRAWAAMGGAETAESYGVPPVSLLKGDWHQFLFDLRAAVPSSHIDFVGAFYDSFEMGDYLFVHAGVRPGVALDAQNPRDLRWIRGEFLDSASDFGKVVVHGHTVAAEPCSQNNRIGIDTGAYRSGRLTALRLEGAERAFIATGAAQ